ncbi:MAG: hypothetical protein ACLGIN_00640 [Candidatus Sericytochromatia bacterium]
MDEQREFPLRPFPRRLIRSLVGFAAAGTIMALVVWSDGMGGPWLPLAIALPCWLIPMAFAWQVHRQGFDPLCRLVVDDRGLTAHSRDGQARFVSWPAVTRLVQAEAFRYKAWAVIGAEQPIRWHGELEDPDGFQAFMAERTGLAWEHASRLPD